MVRLFNENQEEIATSDTYYDAAPQLTVDFELSSAPYRGRPECERYLERIEPWLGNARLSELSDEDLRILSGKACLPLDHLTCLRFDARYRERYQVEGCLFYGLCRAGFDQQSWSGAKPSRWREALQDAVERRIIPGPADGDSAEALELFLDNAVEELRRVAVALSFTPDADTSDAAGPTLGLGQALRTSPLLSLNTQVQLVDFIKGYDGPAADIWAKAAENGFSEEQLAAAQTTLQTSLLVHHSRPLLHHLQQQNQTRSVRWLAGLTQEQLVTMIDEAGSDDEPALPPNFANAADFARTILRNLDHYLPTDRLFYSLQRETEAAPVAAGSPLFNLYAPLNLDETGTESQIRQKIQYVHTFWQNNPALDLRHADLVQQRVYINGEATPLNWDNIPAEDQPDILNQVRAYQRIEPLAGDTETRTQLLMAGYHAGFQVANTPTIQLINDTGVSLEMAESIQAAAREQVMRGELTRWEVLNRVYDLPVRIISSDPAIDNAFRDLDDFEQLFGSQNFCNCPHCNSVLSPSAYFVDLMRFIEKEVSRNEEIFGPYDDPRRSSPLYLPNRRPDLWQLELSCENTHTEIPYLAVVIDVFEQFLILRLDDVPDRARLYQHLAEAHSTMAQPFLPALEEIRLYLSHFKLTRADIFKALGREQIDLGFRTLPAYKLEYLGLSLPELDIIGNADLDPSRVRRLFGLPDSSTERRIPVPHFLQVTNLSRAELDDLRAAETLAGLGVDIKREPIPDTLGQQFNEFLTGLNPAGLDLIHRWLRLWRKSGWDLPIFDFVLAQLHAAGLALLLDESAVYGLAELKIVQDSFSLKVEEVVALFAPLPDPDPTSLFYREQGSLYQRLFGAEPFSGDPLTIRNFESDEPTVELPYPDAYRLLAGLSLSEAELTALVIHLRHPLTPGGTGPERTVSLTHENISLLYRHALLARRLKLSLADFFALIRLVLTSGRTSLGPLPDFLTLANGLADLEALPFSIAELAWLVLDQTSESLSLALTAEQIEALQSQLIETDNEGAYLLFSNTFRWNQEEAEQVMALTGTTLEALRTAATAGTLPSLMRPLEKWGLFKDRLQLEVDHLTFIAGHDTLFTDPAAPSLALVHHLSAYHRLVSADHVALESAHTWLSSYDRSLPGESLRTLAHLLKTEPAIIGSIREVLTLDSHALAAIMQIQGVLGVIQLLGINGNALDQITAAAYADLQQGRDALLGAFQAKYPDEAKRTELLGPYQDQLLNLKRDALVDYLLSAEFAESSGVEVALRDPLDLYRFFLMDPEMDVCARTSPVLAGISSLQLYVHRCLMNLEQANDPALYYVRPSAIPRDEWAWRKNYRVWEANRKIFLYPENYLLSDLRDDMTPFFKELQDELMQQEISFESAEIAYKNYFQKFLKVANLKITGAYRDAPNQILYIVGHTFEDPPQYHYRTFTYQADNPYQGVWSPWYKVDLSINAPVVSPIVYQGKLYIVWLEINTRVQREFEAGSSLFRGFHHKISLKFSYQTIDNRWLSPTTINFREVKDKVTYPERNNIWFDSEKDSLIYNTSYSGERVYEIELEKYSLTGYQWDRIYPYIKDKELLFYFGESLDLYGGTTSASYFNKISMLDKSVVQLSGSPSHAQGWYYHKTAGVEGDEDFEYITELRDKLSSHHDIHAYSIVAVNDYDYDVIASIEADSFLLQPLPDSSPVPMFAQRLGTTVAGELGAVLYRYGLDTLLSPDTQMEHLESSEPWEDSDFVQFETETDHIDFVGACGIYYRELYFHIPFLIAERLNTDQKFADADRWLRYIVDPTASEEDGLDQPEDRNWRYVPFRSQEIEKLRQILTNPEALDKYRTDPFNPYAIARLRSGAFQKAVVMKYIDNLLDWGDYLFTQFTYEAINEALLLYLTALDILGERPANLGPCSVPIQTTYERVAAQEAGESEFAVLENFRLPGTDEIERQRSRHLTSTDHTFQIYPDGVTLASAVPGLEVDFSLDDRPAPRENGTNGAGPTPAPRSGSETGSRYTTHFISTMAETRMVFCVPVNEQLLGYWDRVEDRLFKIRHCMDIEGVRRSLALFEPPLNPLLLARAKAAGLSLEDMLHRPAQLPHYRAGVMLERAKSVIGTVQSFGSALLSALEKKDAEELRVMQVTHEQNILKMTRQVKEKQILQEQRQLRSLEESKINIQNRINHYTQLIQTGLTEWEQTQQVARHSATLMKATSSIFFGSSSILALLPQLGSPWAMTYGGRELHNYAKNWGLFLDKLAEISSDVAVSAGIEATFQRRAEEWLFQLASFHQELKQVEQSTEAAKIRVEIAERDLEIYEKNVEQSREQFEFIRDKFSGVGLYTWQATHLTRLYRQAYLLAYEIAKQAELACKFERPDENSYISNENWPQDKAGLLAGEHLMQQLLQCEHAYHSNNRRDLELTKHISLARLDPIAFIQLKETGACEFALPETLFDLDYPGHYNRRIKSVSLTIPCVTGSYTSINCTLTLTGDSVRIDPTVELEPNNTYPRQTSLPDPDDMRFQDNLGITGQSIATSSAQNDSGVFELNFRDERYLPFEGAGVISDWKLDLSGKWEFADDGGPQTIDLSQFDFDTITDVILHIRYTARDGGHTFKRAAVENLVSVSGNPDTPQFRLFSLRHEFPNEWHQLLHSVNEDGLQIVALPLVKDRFPFLVQSHGISVDMQRVDLFVKIKPDPAETITASNLMLALETGRASNVTSLPALRLWNGLLRTELASPGSPGDWTFALWRQEPGGTDDRHPVTPDAVEDIFLVCHYSISS